MELYVEVIIMFSQNIPVLLSLLAQCRIAFTVPPLVLALVLSHLLANAEHLIWDKKNLPELSFPFATMSDVVQTSDSCICLDFRVKCLWAEPLDNQ